MCLTWEYIPVFDERLCLRALVPFIFFKSKVSHVINIKHVAFRL